MRERAKVPGLMVNLRRCSASVDINTRLPIEKSIPSLSEKFSDDINGIPESTYFGIRCEGFGSITSATESKSLQDHVLGTAKSSSPPSSWRGITTGALLLCFVATKFSFEELPETNEDDFNEEEIETLTEMICRAGDEPGTKAAALLVLMATLENSSHPKALANTAKHLAFTCCGELNVYSMVDTQIAVAEGELLAAT